MEAAKRTRRLWTFHGGVHPVQHKHESTREPIQAAHVPARVTLPLHQHIGEPAEPVVEVGERVLKGQVVARANGFVSAPVHASISGTVTDIADYPIPHPSGLTALCVVIDSDGEDRWIDREPVTDYESLEPSALRNVIREAGIVGLGGAGFPSYIKLNPGHQKAIKTLILNGVECEPYITCDDILMRERAAEIVGGLHIIRHALHAEECLIAIEDNKPEALDAMRRATADIEQIKVVKVPTLYPQGSEKQLVKVLTGKEVPSDGLCLNIGVVGVNVGTTAAVYRAIHHGEPLISRIVTVTGRAVPSPRNVEARLGTPMEELLRQCGGDPDHLERLIMGGPMMGFAMKQTDLPVIKTTNCVLAAGTADLPPAKPVMPCIRCGACADACPVNLLPQQLYWHARHKDLDKVQEYNLFDCIECGCCSYVCPSNIPLVQYYRYAKGDIWTREREKEKSDVARRRHEARQARIEREKAEREAKRKKKTGEKAASEARKQKQAEVDAAVQRAESRRKSAQQEAEQRRAAARQRSDGTPAAREGGERKADSEVD